MKKGGIQEAYTRYATLQEHGGEEYEFDPDDLINLVYQLGSVKKQDLAIEVLKLNIQAFPQHVESYQHLAEICRRQGNAPLAVRWLLKALSLEPGNAALKSFLEKTYPMQGQFPVVFPRIETERLLLREITPEDTIAIFQNFSDPEVARWFFERPHTKMDETKKFVDQFIDDFQHGRGLTWAIEWKENGQCIGTCGYGEVEVGARGEIGFDLAKAYWGRGVMSETLSAVLAYGFIALRLRYVDTNTDLQNTRARHLLEKCGFKLENTLEDSVDYRLTREVWRKLMP